jgi:hypothetical protein
MTILILQKNRVTATVKVTGSGTVTLASLGLGDETLATPNVTIHEVFFSCDPTKTLKVTRSGTDALSLTGTDHWAFNGMSIIDNPTSDIVINSTDANSTIILVVRKVSGYNFPSPQTLGYFP